MMWKVGRRFKREGIHVYLWLIHVYVWQKLTRYCKAIIFQLKINKCFVLKKQRKLFFLVMTGNDAQHWAPW